MNHEIARKTRLAAAAVLAAGFGTSVEAAHPLLTEDTGTQGEGKYQLELMVDKTRDNPDGADRSSIRYRVLGFIYSPTPAIDLDAGLKHGHGRAATDRAFLLGATFRW